MKTSERDRTNEIYKKINLHELPFLLKPQELNDFGLDIANGLTKAMSGIGINPALKWCLSTVKKCKVFILVYQANVRGLPIYKEEIAKKLVEYSYKTIATIIDEGIQKNYYVPLEPSEHLDGKKITDKKVKNIRPSSDLVAAFYNWNIERIALTANLIKKYK